MGRIVDEVKREVQSKVHEINMQKETIGRKDLDIKALNQQLNEMKMKLDDAMKSLESNG